MNLNPVVGMENVRTCRMHTDVHAIMVTVEVSVILVSFKSVIYYPLQAICDLYRGYARVGFLIFIYTVAPPYHG